MYYGANVDPAHLPIYRKADHGPPPAWVLRAQHDLILGRIGVIAAEDLGKCGRTTFAAAHDHILFVWREARQGGWHLTSVFLPHLFEEET